ncbi:MAG: hypothetical protein NC299_11780 [Lachnospiraceae bacterium]|nr:hypothetical protein [Lachnospiraceae bacterium]
MGFKKFPDDLDEWAWYNDNTALLLYVRLRYEAKYKPCDVGDVHLERGQLMTSIREIAETNGVSIRHTRTALERLEKTHKIAIKSTSKYSIITLIDYDCDSESDTQSDTLTTHQRHTERHTNDTLTTHQRHTNDTASLLTTNSKQADKQTNAHARGGGVLSADLKSSFDRFWAAYPKKTSKQNALKAWQRLQPDEDLTNLILSSLERHKKTEQWTKDNGQFIPYPASWLNGRRWEDVMTVDNSGNAPPPSEKTDEQWLEGF